MTEEGRLLALLDSDPQRGMEELIDRYSGLVGHVAGRYLKDDEDVKECVNDTFLEFYRRRARFDARRGTVEIYLGLLAKSLALDRLRRNARTADTVGLTDCPDPRLALEEAEERADMERALSELSEEDAKLIRMKYFDGMTVREAAQRLGIPYEAAKKRHQRSLKKLKALLLAGLCVLLALLLAACAYLLLRRFGIVPGMGAMRADAPCYVLREEAAGELDGMSFTADEVLRVGGSLAVFGTLTSDGEPLPGDWELGVMLDPAIRTEDGSLQLNTMVSWDAGDPRAAELMLFRTGAEGLPEGDITLVLCGREVLLPMREVEKDAPESCSLDMGELGGLAARAERGPDGTTVEIYPLNTGDLSISPYLVYDAYHQFKAGDVTLTDSQGREYIGEWTFDRAGYVNDAISRWSFGDLPAGKYTLTVPCLYMTFEASGGSLPVQSPEGAALELPFGRLNLLGWEPGRRTIPFSGEELTEGYEALLRWEPPEGSGLTLVSMPICAEVPRPESYPLSLSVEQSQEPAADNEFRVFCHVGSGADMEAAVLSVDGRVTLRWDRTFNLELTVE